MEVRPAAVVFDVNGTLSDLSPMPDRFAEVGAARELARTWFAALLRDGFALTAAGVRPSFARLAEGALAELLERLPLNRSLPDAVAHVMSGFHGLAPHPDVPAGVRALRELGLPLYTFSNGSAGVAERLLERSGLLGEFTALLSVDDAPAWKPDPRSYAYAAQACGVHPGGLLLVAVHPWDTDGAGRAGLPAAWLNRGGASYPDQFRPPDLTAADLPELARKLRELPARAGG